MTAPTIQTVSTFRLRADGWIVLILSAALLIASGSKWLPLDFTESLGFATGAICVWLTARENIWNWPIGLANNVFFAILFWRSRLFADYHLQWVYFGLGVYGWWQWLRGGENQTELPISKAKAWEWSALAVFVAAGTWILWNLMLSVNGAAPFLDSFTTVLSLAAQYLLCRKRIENWYVWILADLIYVPLYFHRQLPLTAALYAGFIVLCVLGLIRWRKELALS